MIVENILNRNLEIDKATYREAYKFVKLICPNFSKEKMGKMVFDYTHLCSG